MPRTGFTLFETPIGGCAIAWRADLVAALQLPEANPQRTVERLRRHLPGALADAPPPQVVRAIEQIRALLDGERRDLRDIGLDLGGIGPFARRVYDFTRGVGPGRTTTYGELARALGEPGAARAVGHALGANPFAIIVPCHRVLGADGRAGGFSARGGVATKLRLLLIERARLGDAPGLFDGEE